MIFSIDIGLNLGLLFAIAVGIVVILYLIKFIIIHFRQRKIDKIISSYKLKEGNSSESSKDELKKPFKKAIPFTKRGKKMGLTWGGGNIKGANAKRPIKKEFLK